MKTNKFVIGLGIMASMTFAQPKPVEYGGVEMNVVDSNYINLEIDEEDSIVYIDYDQFEELDDLQLGKVYFSEHGVYMYFGKRQ